MTFENDIKNSLETLNSGGIILYPTDTIWGLGCDATNEKAVAKIYVLKQRAESKSMIILLGESKNIYKYSKAPSPTINELLNNTDKALTIIYPEAKNIASNLIAQDGSIAIRIVNDIFCEKLIMLFDKPIVSTSANIAGEMSPVSFDSINENIKKGADYIVQHRRDDYNFKSPSKILFWKNDEEILVIRN